MGESPYFADDQFTAADIIVGFGPATMRVFFPRELKFYPNILAYLKVVGEKPAYRPALQKGEPKMAPLLT